MIIIIPLGGLGMRFKDAGHTLPKPLINVMGKPIIYWLLDNLKLTNIDLVIIPYNKELSKYRFEDRLTKDYKNIKFKFIKLEHNTNGAAETVLFSLLQLTLEDTPILCLDGDNFYTKDIISQWNGDNCVYVFEDNSTNESFSYINYINNKITDIVEKQKISNLASTGGYGFNSYKLLQYYCDKIIKNNIKQKNEFYISGVIKEMIKDNIEFVYKKVNNDDYICLGTPLHIRIFCNNYPVISMLTRNKILESKRYCFDLDNTLVTFPKKSGDYTSVEPIQKNIDIVNYLKKLGHTIIIYTARRMGTHNSNQGKVLADIGKLTFDTLSKFNIPYDEIYFGKPNADYYIDDLAISSYEDLEKELGFYQSNISPRDFNTVSTSSIDIIKKESNDLSSEIHYYNNIPNCIKDIFPVMFQFDTNNKWYNMEKIMGVPISKLYLSEELTIPQLDSIMDSINRIHNCKVENIENINIYANYSQKLQERYNKYDYSKFENSSILYNEILEGLLKYENNNKGQIVVIHGDPVFTNILINKFGKIKFIDMRGKLGSINTIYGDNLYDWAKLYQSLIGYDEILENHNINLNYKNKMIDYFEKKIISNNHLVELDYLKIITKSLLFTLIPLHDNDKCYEYYKLINIIK